MSAPNRLFPAFASRDKAESSELRTFCAYRHKVLRVFPQALMSVVSTDVRFSQDAIAECSVLSKRRTRPIELGRRSLGAGLTKGCAQHAKCNKIRIFA